MYVSLNLTKSPFYQIRLCVYVVIGASRIYLKYTYLILLKFTICVDFNLLFFFLTIVKFGQQTPKAPDFKVQGRFTSLGISSKNLTHFTRGVHLPATVSLVNDVVQ